MGMHRSGTSFLTDCVGALGFELPHDRGGPARDNIHGHFEPKALVAVNNDILAAQGSGWDRMSPFQPTRLDGMLKTQMAQAVRHCYGDAHRIVLKDPRLSLTLPVWREWFDERGDRVSALIALRDPQEVVQSLAKRNGFLSDYSMGLWLSHTLGSLTATAGMPRLLVRFPHWAKAPSGLIRQVADLTGTDVPQDIDTLVSGRFEADEVHARGDMLTNRPNGPLGMLAIEVYQALIADPHGSLPDQAQVAQWMEQFIGSAQAAIGAEASRKLALEAAALDFDVRAADLRREKDRLADLIAGRDEDARQLQKHIASAEKQRNELQDLVDDLRIRHSEMEKHLAATEAQRDQLQDMADDLHKQNLTLSRHVAATEKQRDDLQAVTDQQARDLTQERDSRIMAENQRDQMATQAENYMIEFKSALKDIDHHKAQFDQLGAFAEQLQEQNAFLAERLTIERLSIAKPLYRRIYGFSGRQLRRILPASVIERLKRRVPQPGGIPARLAFAPLPAQTAPETAFSAIPPRQNDKADIFVMSIINWDFRTQRPQHLAVEMARLGHRVFYIEMDRDIGPGTAREVAPGVHVLRLSSRGLRGIKNYTGIPGPRQARQWIDHFHELADSIGISPTAHIIAEHPYWWHFIRHLAPRFQIAFDCMDDIAGFSNTEPHVIDAEKEMIQNADKMFVSSQYLQKKYSKIRDVVMVRNGTDVSHFLSDDDGADPAFLRGKVAAGKIRVGYVGAIAEWFDTDLVENIARNNPDFDIHLCGAVTAGAPLRLDQQPNVTMHGEIPYSDVPAFLRAMDVLIIPFQLLPIIKACDPVKFYEYAAVMRPTVATSMPELDRAGDLVTRADDAKTFAKGIRDAADKARDPDHGTALRQYALDNAWSFRATDLVNELTREPLLSVVVLAYGDAALTMATLHSLLGSGPVYPNLEVIVSDNGSSDDARTRMGALAAADDRLRIITNAENLGFARGNNVGIKAARGEYILLLNNDTFIAPDALLAMLRHLQRNPKVGIVGPMTNNIGNEARIEVAYGDMDDMMTTARALTTGHRGQWTPIPVAAYFCALFRKSDLDRIGDLPTEYGRGMFEDDDHCASFRAAGFEIALAEDAFVHHHLSATFNALPSDEKQALFDTNKAIFEGRWGEWVPHRYRTARPEASLPETSQP